MLAYKRSREARLVWRARLKGHKGWVRIFSGNSPECHRTALGAHTGPAEEGTMDTNAQKLGDSPSERQQQQNSSISRERTERWGVGVNGWAYAPPPPQACWVKSKAELLGLLDGTLVSILERSPPAGGEWQWQRREPESWQEGRAWQWLTTNALLKQELRPFHGLPCPYHGAHFPI